MRFYFMVLSVKIGQIPKDILGAKLGESELVVYILALNQLLYLLPCMAILAGDAENAYDAFFFPKSARYVVTEKTVSKIEKS